MAFGGIRGTLTGAANSATNPTNATGSVAVSVGDLVFVAVGEQTAPTMTGVTSSFVTTYTATQAALDAGTVAGRAFWGRVTSAGTLTSISVAMTASSNNVSIVAVVFEGPFQSSPLDANPTIVEDTTSSFSAPATGTLAQADELVVAWSVNGAAGNWTATSPNVNRAELATQSILTTRIGSWVVSSTSTVTPAWTGTAPTDSVIGTNSFKAASAHVGSMASAGVGTMTSAATVETAAAVAVWGGGFAAFGEASFAGAFQHIKYEVSSASAAVGTLSTTGSKVKERTSAFGAVGTMDSAGEVPVAGKAMSAGYGAWGELAFGEAVRTGFTLSVTMAVSAAGALASTASHTIPRTSTVAAVGTMASARTRNIPRTTLAAAVGTMASARTRTIPRTSAIAAVGAMAAAFTKSIARSTTFSAIGTMASAALRLSNRTTIMAGVGSMVSTYTISKFYSRTSAFAAIGAMASVWGRLIPRTSAVAAVGAMASARTRTIPRTTTVSAVGTMAAAGGRTIPAVSAFGAAGAMASAWTRTIPRTTLINGVGAMASFGDAAGVIQRSSAFSAAGAMASAASHVIPRTSVFSATGAMTSAGETSLGRTTAFSATGTVTSVATLIPGVVGETYNRTALFSATALMESAATLTQPSAIVYQFPIGKSLGSDYGRRGSQMARRTGFRPKIRSGSYR